MEKIVYNIETDFKPKTVSPVVPITYQVLYLVNLKLEEFKRNNALSEYDTDITHNKTKPETVQVKDKVALSIKEAAEYSNIGINKLESILRSPRCPFVLYVGNKKLVKRKEFEKYISENVEI